MLKATGKSLFAGLLCTLLIGQASAAVVLLNDNRAFSYTGNPLPLHPSVPFAYWSPSFSQESQMTVDGFTAKGSGEENGSVNYRTESVFDFTFQVTDAVQFDMTGTLRASNQYDGGNNARADFVFSSNVGGVLATASVESLVLSSQTDWDYINFSQILNPGIYHISMDAKGLTGFGGYASYQLSGAFTSLSLPPAPVPIPAAGWMFMSALGALTLRKRRQ